MAYRLVSGILLGAANTGLTLEAQLYDQAGTPVGSAVTTGFVEHSGGLYQWDYAAFPDGFQGTALIQVSPGGAAKTLLSINPTEVETASVVWDAVLADHQDAGSTGEALDAAGGAGLTAADVWTHTPRTLTSFGTLVADIAVSVWTYVTRTLTQIITAVDPPPVITGDTITVRRGDTWTIPITGLGSLVGRSKLWFTIKLTSTDTDTEAIVQIEETAGLVRLNGAAGTAGQGSLVVDDEGPGDVTITVAAVATAGIYPSSRYEYDVQMLSAAGISTLTSGSVTVIFDVTGATS